MQIEEITVPGSVRDVWPIIILKNYDLTGQMYVFCEKNITVRPTGKPKKLKLK